MLKKKTMQQKAVTILLGGAAKERIRATMPVQTENAGRLQSWRLVIANTTGVRAAAATSRRHHCTAQPAQHSQQQAMMMKVGITIPRRGVHTGKGPQERNRPANAIPDGCVRRVPARTPPPPPPPPPQRSLSFSFLIREYTAYIIFIKIDFILFFGDKYARTYVHTLVYGNTYVQFSRSPFTYTVINGAFDC